jgi:hypothetical protein
MISPEKIKSDLDQFGAMVRDTLAPMLWDFFYKLKEQGFSDEQALALTLEQFRMIVGYSKKE